MKTQTKILVIDDERLILDCFECAFLPPAYEVLTAPSVKLGIELFHTERPDVVVLDVRMPDGSGLDVLKTIHDFDSKIPVVLMTGFGTAAIAIEAMRMGAFEYLLKPLQMEHLTQVIGSAAETSRMMRTPALLPNQNGESAPDSDGLKGDRIVGSSPAMQDVYRSIGRVASRNVTVLILGESGTGKEVVARAIYQYSNRSGQRFLPINCAAIPEQLLESELFGHEKGAFTGADRKRIGKFELASEGTLFLDEIGDMTPLMQTKILRGLQDQQFERLGGGETIRTDARLIAATNKDLASAIKDGTFRSDLFYRLNVYTIELPPLRERMEDLHDLVEYFVGRYANELDKPVEAVAPAAMELLAAYDWPGNIRELQSVIQRAVLDSTGPMIVPAFLPEPLRSRDVEKRGSQNGAIGQAVGEGEDTLVQELDKLAQQRLQDNSMNVYQEIVAIAERTAIVAALRVTNGNLTETARRLGISRTTLRAKTSSLEISVDQNASVH
ncbi:MAG: sigma-54 dependent transcriptional regulator [Aureliella sp.]